MKVKSLRVQGLKVIIIGGFLFLSNNVIAQTAIKDTSKKIILAFAKKPETTITVPANVVFPTNLLAEADESTAYIEKFANTRKDYVLRMYNKGKKVFPKVMKTFKRYNLPEELRVLIALESAFNGNAVSHCGAVGYWQIMDEVAAEFGMQYVPQPTEEEKKLAAKNKLLGIKDSAIAKKTLIKDDRKNFAKSTAAAARYLRDRRKNLNNDLLLVVASYNCGVGNVKKAIAKTGNANASFWDIKNYLPTETKNYVMNFIALNVLFNNIDKLSKNTLTFKQTIIKTKVEQADIKEGSIL
jgi:soluble lytic murein transglycosylase-like protein